jgi:selenocysteine lyase/cysteine desulfurase
MASVRLPHADPELSQRLLDAHGIEIPTMDGDELLRISVALYTEREDVDRLLAALPAALE